jgi:hypothetical protein
VFGRGLDRIGNLLERHCQLKFVNRIAFLTVADSHVGEPFDDVPLDRFCKGPTCGFFGHHPWAIGKIPFYGKRRISATRVCNVNGAASGDGVFHTNRKPLSFMKKLRPKNPLVLAVIEEAQVASMAIIAGFLSRLPAYHSQRFRKPVQQQSHRPSSSRSRANQLTTIQLYQVYRG